MRLGSSTKVCGLGGIRRLRPAPEVCLQGATEASGSRIAVRPIRRKARRTASFLGATLPRTLAELAADMRMDDSNPSRTDVDRDATHLVVRSTHLRILHVPDPRAARREAAELEHTIGDALFPAGPTQTPTRPP